MGGMVTRPIYSAAELDLAAGQAERELVETPYLDALEGYARGGTGRYHVPGHKGGAGAPPALSRLLGPALAFDVPASTRGFDLGVGPTPLRRAEELAAEAWGARRTWFLVNGASEASHAACLALAHAGPEVVVQRNVHSSTIHALILAGLRPTFVAPAVDAELGIAHCVTPDALLEALDRTPNAVAAIIVSPTYFGAAADVRGLAEACHHRGVPLIADEAWGPHFHFHERLPEDALTAGADLVISGTHKLVGSLTQSAMLHLGGRDWPGLSEQLLERAFGMVRSTSPNSLLLASLDAARAHAASSAGGLLNRALAELDLVKLEVRTRCGLDVLDERVEGRHGVAAFDPLRLAIDVRRAPQDGIALAAALYRYANVNLELATERVVIAHFGIGEPILEQGMRLVEELHAVLDLLAGDPAPARLALPEQPLPGELVMSPRDATFASHDLVPLGSVAGRISAESIVVYPPGVANVLPGERFTAEQVAYLAAMIARRCTLRGTWDGVSAVRVLATSPETRSS
jgi:arginine decarboxylase